MIYELNADRLHIKVCSKGAELQSLKRKDGTELLWQGDAEYWDGQSPLLFPFPGKSWEDKLRIDGEEYTISGYVPALLNDERVELVLVFDNENPYGYIVGARTVYVDGETDTQAKGLTELQVGDTLDFICDYYGYDSEGHSNGVVFLAVIHHISSLPQSEMDARSSPRCRSTSRTNSSAPTARPNIAPNS